MVFNQNHMLFAWSGHFLGSDGQSILDDFAGSLRFVGPGVGDTENEETLLALAQTLISGIGQQASGIPTNAYFDNFKWNQIGTDGRYVNKRQTLMTLGTPSESGVLQARYPLQVACCTTWLTDFRRGRGSKGRTYWPTALVVDSASNLRLTAQRAQDHANWSMGLIGALNQAASGAGPQVPVPGPGGPVPGDPDALVAAVMSDIGEGVSGAITGARTGDRLDIQRRRGNRLEETYYTAT